MIPLVSQTPGPTPMPPVLVGGASLVVPSYRSAGARTTISSVSSGRSRAIQRPSLNG